MGLEHKLAMLNATHVNLNGTGGGGGTLTAETVAGALGSVNERRGVDLLVADLVGIADYQGLENRLYEPLVFMAFNRGWIAPEGMTLQRMVRSLLRLALYEKLVPEKCPACKGRRVRFKRALKKEIACPKCGGRGSMELSRRERLEHLELDLDGWERCWRWRFRDVQAWLDNLTGTAEAEIHRALR